MAAECEKRICTDWSKQQTDSYSMCTANQLSELRPLSVKRECVQCLPFYHQILTKWTPYTRNFKRITPLRVLGWILHIIITHILPLQKCFGTYSVEVFPWPFCSIDLVVKLLCHDVLCVCVVQVGQVHCKTYQSQPTFLIRLYII